MNASKRRVALSRAAGSVARRLNYNCEPLERRVLLDAADDPVVVIFTEPFARINTAFEELVHPWLYKNPGEHVWSLSQLD
jgi:hypothetical protein